jgi:hypothetical protein
VDHDQGLLSIELRFEHPELPGQDHAGGWTIGLALAHLDYTHDLSELVEMNLDLHGTHTLM